MTLTVFPVGENPTKIWGLSPRERLRRIAAAAGMTLSDDNRGPAIAADLAYAFDPAWLRFVAERPGAAVTYGERVALAHVRTAEEAQAVRSGTFAADESFAVEDGLTLVNDELRKRETPFLLPLNACTVGDVERASYWGAYKGVTDLLTKYLWPGIAFHLTRLAAWAGLSPNMVTTLGAIGCVAATFAFAASWYWTGIAVGFLFMVFDTVDGKLARCTITSSKIGEAFDHGIDLVHPPFWWWAWTVGLAAYGTSLPAGWTWPVLAVIVGGYVVQRLIEGAFIGAWGMHIHVWRRFDSWFRLITARRNPNMVILVASLVAGRPDLGIIAVAIWTLLSLLVHAARLAQAALAPKPITSWLS